MIILILTRSGFDDIRPRIEVARDALWINAGVLSPTEIAELRVSGLSVSTFSNPLNVDNLQPDLEVIAEHHPNQVIWTEATAV